METGVFVTSFVWARELGNSYACRFIAHCDWLPKKKTHQALALLAVLHPGVAAAVGEQAVLVQTLAAEARVALWAAEQISVGVLAVANHPAAHHLASLGRGAKTHISHAIKH